MRKGSHMTPEQRQRISDGRKGIFPSDETRAKLSAARLGEKNHMWGKSPSEETKRKHAKSMEKHLQNPEYRRRISESLRGRKQSAETIAKRVAVQSGEKHPRWGKHCSPEVRAKISAALKGRPLPKETCAKMSASRQGVKMPDGFGEKMRVIRKRLWQDPEFRESQLAAMHRNLGNKKTKPEYRMEAILDRHFPGEWKYVGDFKTWIDGKCPDFINVNGRKAVVEVFGRYYHSEEFRGEPESEHVANRIAHFAKSGFSCAILWDDELSDESAVVERVRSICA